ncbi:MAG: hypothetical protein QOE41_4622 [Mycobacterium sp.]|nr:histidine kinase,GAF protein [Mycobacterium sp.]MDT5135311.1 hypothetical protein [Mycobacterium sp.]
MTQKRLRLPGLLPGATSAGGASGAPVGLGRMRAGLLSLLLRPTAPPLALGLVVAGSLVLAETLVLYPLERVVPESVLGVVYLLGVVVVAIGWGFWLAAATSVASVLSFDFFHIAPVFAFSPTRAARGRRRSRW